MRGLVAEGALVQEVAQEAEGEDGRCERIASRLGAAESSGEELGAVLYRPNMLDIPRAGIVELAEGERTSSGNDTSKRVSY